MVTEILLHIPNYCPHICTKVHKPASAKSIFFSFYYVLNHIRIRGVGVTIASDLGDKENILRSKHLPYSFVMVYHQTVSPVG